MDYKIWGVVQERVYQPWLHSMDELKQGLLHVWHVMKTWTKASLTAQLMNGVCIFVLVCEQGWTLRALVVTLSVCLSAQLCDMKRFILC